MNPWGWSVRKTAYPAHHHVFEITTLAISGPIPVAAHIRVDAVQIPNVQPKALPNKQS